MQDYQFVEDVIKMVPGEKRVYFEGYGALARTVDDGFRYGEWESSSAEEIHDIMDMYWMLGPGYQNNRVDNAYSSRFNHAVGDTMKLGTLAKKRVGKFRYKYIFIRNRNKQKNTFSHKGELRSLNDVRRGNV